MKYLTLLTLLIISFSALAQFAPTPSGPQQNAPQTINTGPAYQHKTAYTGAAQLYQAATPLTSSDLTDMSEYGTPISNNFVVTGKSRFDQQVFIQLPPGPGVTSPLRDLRYALQTNGAVASNGYLSTGSVKVKSNGSLTNSALRSTNPSDPAEMVLCAEKSTGKLVLCN